MTPTATQPSLDKTQFIAQADSVCAEANASIEQFAAAGQGLTEAGQIAQIRQGVIDQIRQLQPPADDRATLDQFLQAMSEQVSAGEKIDLALQRGEDTAQFETELDSARSAAESAASTYGFEECGSPISSSGTGTTVTPSGTADTGGTVTPSAPAPAAPTAPSGGTEGGGTDTGGGSTGSGAPSGGTGAPSGGVGPG